MFLSIFNIYFQVSLASHPRWSRKQNLYFSVLNTVLYLRYITFQLLTVRIKAYVSSQTALKKSGSETEPDSSKVKSCVLCPSHASSISDQPLHYNYKEVVFYLPEFKLY